MGDGLRNFDGINLFLLEDTEEGGDDAADEEDEEDEDELFTQFFDDCESS